MNSVSELMSDTDEVRVSPSELDIGQKFASRSRIMAAGVSLCFNLLLHCTVSSILLFIAAFLQYTDNPADLMRNAGYAVHVFTNLQNLFWKWIFSVVTRTEEIFDDTPSSLLFSE